MPTTPLTKEPIKNVKNEIQKKIDEYIRSATSVLTISYETVLNKRKGKIESRMVVRIDRKIVFKEKNLSESVLEDIDQMCELIKSFEDNLVENLIHIVKKEIKEKLNLQENEFEILTNWKTLNRNNTYSKFCYRELEIFVKIYETTIHFFGTYDVEDRIFDEEKNRYILRWFRARLKKDDAKKIVAFFLFR